MKKHSIKIMGIVITLFLTIYCLSAYAATNTVTVEKKIVGLSSGRYAVGTKVTMEIKLNKQVVGTPPILQIYFGKYDAAKVKEITLPEITKATNTITYTYTIQKGDNGELKLSGFKGYSLVDTDSNYVYIDGNYTADFTTKIVADTSMVWSDFSKATYAVTSEDKGNRNGSYILVDGTKLDYNKNEYYVHFSHNANEKLNPLTKKEVYDNAFNEGKKTWQTTIIDNKISGNAVKNIFAEKGEVYITICQVNSETGAVKTVVSSKKVERPTPLPLSQRITGYFFDDETSTFCWEIGGDQVRKLNYKIGSITDEGILRRIKNGESSAMNDLLAYAKSSKALLTGSVVLGKDSTIVDKIEIKHKAYYYVYFQLDDENGTYYPIEDVSLYQGLVSSSVGENLFSYTDKNFSWDLSEENKKPNTNANTTQDGTTAPGTIPQTGETIAFLLAASIVAIVGIIAYKRNKNLQLK